MSDVRRDLAARLANLTPEKRALLAKQLESGTGGLAVSTRATEPIAIIAIACRFPGADSPEAFWDLVRLGIDAITEVPAGRWPSAADSGTPPGTTPSSAANVRRGGFIDQIDRFDAAFFGIAPREAERMDPQQRLFLEVAWEACERAGQTIEMLEASATGVFVGVHSHSSDYATMQLAQRDSMNAYTATGTAHGVIAGRLSYLFDLRGPSLAIDTACSSSLVATHLACQSLRAGETTMAIVGGLNLMVLPDVSAMTAEMQILSPDGRCRSFDARANGFVRGEGCGVVVLKRLRDAQLAGDPVLAVIRGSAVNQDGRTNGLAAPNGLAQQRVITAALRNAGLDAGAVTMIETHGTGTPLGDPIEVDALAAVYGADPGGARCLFGSVKTNVGHLEGAAGIAGLIKTVLALRHGEIPPLVDLQQLNPHMQLDDTRLQPARTLSRWNSPGPRTAGVSSFGFSGTNAHVVVQEAPATAPLTVSLPAAEPTVASNAAGVAQPRLIPISARNEAALSDAVARHTAWLSSPSGIGASWDDVAWTASARRTHHSRRAAFVARSHTELRGSMSAWLTQRRTGEATVGMTAADPRHVTIFAFPDASSARLAMGGELLAEPVFAEAIDGVAAAWPVDLDGSIHDILLGAVPETWLGRPHILQPAYFALQIALASLWRSWGIEPDVVVGEGAGEAAAACVAGVLTLADGARVIAARGRVLPQSEIARSLTDLRPHSSSVAFHSGVASARVAAESLDARYWIGQIRQPAQFVRAIRSVLREAGAGPGGTSRMTRFVELGAGATLHATVHTLAAEQGESTSRQTVAVSSLNPDQSDREAMLCAAGTLYQAGADLAWSRMAAPAAVTDLPTYPWRRTRFWLDSTSTTPLASRDRESTSAEHDWRYEVAWQRAPTALAGDPAGSFLIIGGGSAVTRELASLIRQQGGVARIEASPSDAIPAGQFDLVVDLSCLEAASVTAGGAMLAAPATRVLQHFQASVRTGAPLRFWAVTIGAEAVRGSTPDPTQAAVWGLGRGLALDEPDTWGGLVDLDPAASATANAAWLWPIFASPRRDDQFVLRAGHAYVPRIVRAAPLRVHAAERPSIRRDGAYLITGGLGRLGLRVARWLAAEGAAQIVLIGRTPLPAREAWPTVTDSRTQDQIALLADVETHGARVDIVTADAADPDAMRAVFRRFGDDWLPLRGIVHAAATLDRASPLVLAAADMQRTFRGKLEAAHLLDILSRDHALDLFVLFSSAAAIWGGRDMAAYAAANHAVDAIADRRRQEGLPALSLNWGWWHGGGTDQTLEPALAEAGLRPMSADTALELMGTLAAAGIVRQIVADIDWAAFISSYTARRPRPLFDDIDAEATPPPTSAPLEASAVASDLMSLPPEVRRARCLALVRDEAATVMGLSSASDLDLDRGFFRQGMDSLMTLRLRARLARAVGRELPSTVAFEYPNVRALAAHLAESVPATPAVPSTRRPDGAGVPEVEGDEAALATMLDEALGRLERETPRR